jgi:hypothetical protein
MFIIKPINNNHLGCEYAFLTHLLYNGRMKRLLLSLLVFVMFTPGLSCAKVMHHQNPHRAMTGMMKDMPCCPKDDQKSEPGTMLFKDCAKIDLQHVGDASLLKKADVDKIIPYIVPRNLAAAGFVLTPARYIHGPEPPEIAGSYPPVFLATQRLRI